GDLAWGAELPTPETPAWVALRLASAPQRALVVWTATATYNYDDTTWGAPGAYFIESSDDSTNGADGTWRLEVEVADNGFRTRGHLIELEGRRWIRMTILGGTEQTSEYGVVL